MVSWTLVLLITMKDGSISKPDFGGFPSLDSCTHRGNELQKIMGKANPTVTICREIKLPLSEGAK